MSAICLKIHMPYSWWRTGDGLYKPSKAGLPLYLDALKKELASLGEDLEEHEINAIHFEGGYLGLLLPDDFTDMMAAIHKAFHLAADVEISGTLFPGSMDMALISTYKNYHVGPLMFEVPSLMMRECEEQKLPNVLQLLDHTKYLMSSFQEGNWGLSITRGLPGRDADKWAHIGKSILHYQPMHVVFVPVSGLEENGIEACTELLERSGYRRLAEDFYSLAPQAPRYLTAAQTAAVGLGAVSTLDGYKTRNTSDLKRYLNSAADYRNLLIEVTEL